MQTVPYVAFFFTLGNTVTVAVGVQWPDEDEPEFFSEPIVFCPN